MRDASSGNCSAKTSGQLAATSAHSTGLSSTKIKLSNPTPSSLANDFKFSDLASQLRRTAAKSDSRSGISVLSEKTARTSASLFLLQRHKSIPLSRWRRINSWSCLRAESNSMQLGPSSPQTPDQRVLSQSRAMTLKGEELRAWNLRAIAVASDVKKTGV